MGNWSQNPKSYLKDGQATKDTDWYLDLVIYQFIPLDRQNTKNLDGCLGLKNQLNPTYGVNRSLRTLTGVGV